MASEEFIFTVSILGDLIRIQLSQKILQDFLSLPPIQDEIELLVSRTTTDTFKEALPRGAMRRVTIDHHPVHIKNNSTQHVKRSDYGKPSQVSWAIR